MSSNRISRAINICVALVTLWAAHSAKAQFAAPVQASQLQLPANPAQWINSPPLSTQMLKGKAAVFYLYEER